MTTPSSRGVTRRSPRSEKQRSTLGSTHRPINNMLAASSTALLDLPLAATSSSPCYYPEEALLAEDELEKISSLRLSRGFERASTVIARARVAGAAVRCIFSFFFCGWGGGGVSTIEQLLARNTAGCTWSSAPGPHDLRRTMSPSNWRGDPSTS